MVNLSGFAAFDPRFWRVHFVKLSQLDKWQKIRWLRISLNSTSSHDLVGVTLIKINQLMLVRICCFRKSFLQL